MNNIIITRRRYCLALALHYTHIRSVRRYIHYTYTSIGILYMVVVRLLNASAAYTRTYYMRRRRLRRLLLLLLLFICGIWPNCHRRRVYVRLFVYIVAGGWLFHTWSAARRLYVYLLFAYRYALILYFLSLRAARACLRYVITRVFVIIYIRSPAAASDVRWDKIIIINVYCWWRP